MFNYVTLCNSKYHFTYKGFMLTNVDNFLCSDCIVLITRYLIDN